MVVTSSSRVCYRLRGPGSMIPPSVINAEDADDSVKSGVGHVNAPPVDALEAGSACSYKCTGYRDAARSVTLLRRQQPLGRPVRTFGNKAP